MNRWRWTLAVTFVAAVGLGPVALLEEPPDQASPSGPSVIPTVTPGDPPSTPDAVPTVGLPSLAIALPDVPDPKVCELAEEAAKGNVISWPADLAPWAMHVARHLRATGNPIDLALSTLVGKKADWEPRTLSSQVEAVARAATLTSDAALYGLALRACSRLPVASADVGACQQLDRAQLPRLDPDNVQLWLDSATHAHTRGELATALDALYHASVARDFETPSKVAARRLAAAMPEDLPAWVRFALLERFMRDQGLASQDGEVKTAIDWAGPCTNGAMADANVHQLCEKLAQNLLEHSSNSDTLWAGMIVAEEVPWSQERLVPIQRDTWLLYESKRRLPTLPEVACGGTSHGLAMLDALMADRAVALLRSDRLQQGMTATAERREAKRAAEEEKSKQDHQQ